MREVRHSGTWFDTFFKKSLPCILMSTLPFPAVRLSLLMNKEMMKISFSSRSVISLDSYRPGEDSCITTLSRHLSLHSDYVKPVFACWHRISSECCRNRKLKSEADSIEYWLSFTSGLGKFPTFQNAGA